MKIYTSAAHINTKQLIPILRKILSGLYVIALAAVLSIPSTSSQAASKEAQPSDSGSSDCSQLMTWPVKNARISKHFDAPQKRWLAGHRGVDLEAKPSTEILAPSDGVVVFTGKVAGKDVVSIEHSQGWRSTFEPARTDLQIGMRIKRGEPFATRSSGKSNHCEDSCIHWGIKISPDSYANPEKMVKLRRIIIQRPQD